MDACFNPQEIARIAKRIEANGASFYRGAAERADDPFAKELLENLASMEEEHHRRFGDLETRWTSPESLETFFDPDGDASKVLTAFADGKIFDVYSETGPPVTGKETLEEILETALGMEKDSVVFYLSIQACAKTGQDRERIGEIIQEEMKHITLLGDALERHRKGDCS